MVDIGKLPVESNVTNTILRAKKKIQDIKNVLTDIKKLNVENWKEDTFKDLIEPKIKRNIDFHLKKSIWRRTLWRNYSN